MASPVCRRPAGGPGRRAAPGRGAHDATHWSTRALAARHGISRQTVSEIWRAFGLKPWRQDEFKVSPDPDLVEKTRDIVGLHLNPPVAAAVVRGR